MPPLMALMPVLPLTSACTVEWVAIDPTTAADVAGVTITNPTLYGIDLSGSVGETALAPSLPPLLPALESENLFAQVAAP